MTQWYWFFFSVKKFATPPRTRPWLRSWEICDGCFPMMSALLNKMRKRHGAFIMALKGSVNVLLPFIIHKKWVKFATPFYNPIIFIQKNHYSYIQRKCQQACALRLPLKMYWTLFLVHFCCSWTHWRGTQLINLLAKRQCCGGWISWRTRLAMHEANLRKGVGDLKFWMNWWRSFANALIVHQNISLSSFTVGITPLWGGWNSFIIRKCGLLG